MGKDAKFVVRLSVSERLSLEKRLSQARAAKAKLLRARMLLKADADGPAWSDPAIAEAFDVSLSTVHRLRERFVWEGFDAALDRQPFCRTKPRTLDGAKEARLIATACSAPPKGQARWTMPLFADKLVELKIVESISGETVRKTLQKNEIKPWLREQWVIPPDANAEFVCQMEEVLDVDQRPFDPKRPLVTIDEAMKPLIRGSTFDRQAGDSRHPQAWPLAQHGGDRTGSRPAAMPRSTHPGLPNLADRSRRVGNFSQHRRSQSPLAIHDH